MNDPYGPPGGGYQGGGGYQQGGGNQGGGYEQGGGNQGSGYQQGGGYQGSGYQQGGGGYQGSGYQQGGGGYQQGGGYPGYGGPQQDYNQQQQQGYLQGGPVDFQGAIGNQFQNVLNFNGRASRSAYWWYALALIMMSPGFARF